jgi:hypothetical protein
VRTRSKPKPRRRLPGKKTKAREPSSGPKKTSPGLPEEIEKNFVEGLRARGEVITVSAKGGPLPPGATHTLEKGAPGSRARPKRRRFSAF